MSSDATSAHDGTGRRATGSVVRVFLAVEQELLGRGLRRVVEASGDVAVVGAASTVAEPLSEVVASRADVCIVDHGEDGRALALCQGLGHADPSVRCIVFADGDLREVTAAAAEAGASCVLGMDTDIELLLEVLRRSGMVGKAERKGAPPNRAGLVPLPVEVQGLSVRELQLLGLLAQGVSNREAADRLMLAVSTVKAGMTALMRKLGFRTRTQLAVYAVGLQRRGINLDLLAGLPHDQPGAGARSYDEQAGLSIGGPTAVPEGFTSHCTKDCHGDV